MMTDKDIKVSVIVPVYNAERYLEKCVESICNQTLKELELILVDDGSTDRSSKMCDELQGMDDRIIVIHKINEGAAKARNAGIQKARGQYVAFVDADDFVLPEMYSKLTEYAETNCLDTCFCSWSNYKDGISTPRNETEKDFVVRGRKDTDDFMLESIGPNPEYPREARYFLTLWHAIYSRDIIERHKLEIPNKRTAEDYIFNIKYLCKAESVGYIRGNYYQYVFNNQSVTRGG